MRHAGSFYARICSQADRFARLGHLLCLPGDDPRNPPGWLIFAKVNPVCYPAIWA